MDFSNLKNSDLSILLGPDYVPEGTYEVCLHDIDLCLTKDNDHYYIMTNFEITSGVYNGRIIKQIWSLRRGQEARTSARINNYISKISSETVNVTNNTIPGLFDKIKSRLLNEKFIAWLVKDVDHRSEILYAEKASLSF